MKRWRNLNPKRRRQLVMLVGVGLLVLVYFRTRGAGAPAAVDQAAGDPLQSSLDGTTAPTGPTNPWDPEWPTGSGGTISGTSTPTTPATPAAVAKRPGYAAWLKDHPNATLTQRIKALRRLIGHRRGNLANEARLLAQLSARRARQRQRQADQGPRTGPPIRHGGAPGPGVIASGSGAIRRTSGIARSSSPATAPVRRRHPVGARTMQGNRHSTRRPI